MQNIKTRILSETGIALALATLLSLIKVFQLPQGGSVSLEMLPIIFIALRWGIKPGLLLGTGFGILQFFISGYVVHWAQLFLDYPVAFGVLGLAGLMRFFFKNSNLKEQILYVVTGTIIGGLFRFLAHFISGVVFFGHYAGEQNIFLYSFIYNITYMLPEIIITAVAMVLLINGISKSPLANIEEGI